MTEQLTAIVLAAGLSRRMGKDNKLLLPFGETTILEATLSNILSAELGETCVVVGHEAENVMPILMLNLKLQQSLSSTKQSNTQLLTNIHYEKGMTTTIQTGVEAASDASIGYMICLSDMPFISPAEYQFLKEQFLTIWTKDPQAIVQPTFEGKRGNPTIFSSVHKKDILSLTYTEGCKPIVQVHQKHVYLVEMPTDSILKDIDSKEEYTKIISNK
jgi:molybdenum cofactor cytidylyltransferase